MLPDLPQDEEGDEVDRYYVVAVSILGLIQLNCLRLCLEGISQCIAVVFLQIEEVSNNIVQKDSASPFDYMVVQIIVDFKKCNVIFRTFRDVLKCCLHQIVLQTYDCQ